jgi:hypothetical protein
LRCWTVLTKESLVDLQPLVVVNMQQSAYRSEKQSLRGPGWGGVETYLATHLCPAVVPGIDVVEIEAAALEVVAECHVA